MKSEREVAQLCLTLRDPVDCSLPGSSVHGIFPGKSTGVVYCVSNAIFVSVSLNPPDNLAKLVCYLPFLDEAGEAIEVKYLPDLVLLVNSKCLHWKLGVAESRVTSYN